MSVRPVAFGLTGLVAIIGLSGPLCGADDYFTTEHYSYIQAAPRVTAAPVPGTGTISCRPKHALTCADPNDKSDIEATPLGEGYIKIDFSRYFDVVRDKPHSCGYATYTRLMALPKKYLTSLWRTNPNEAWNYWNGWSGWNSHDSDIEVWTVEDVESFKLTQLLVCSCRPMYAFLDNDTPKVVLPRQEKSYMYEWFSNPEGDSRTLQIFWDMLTLKKRDKVIVWPPLQGGEGDSEPGGRPPLQGVTKGTDIHLQMRAERILGGGLIRVILPRIPPNASVVQYMEDGWTQCLKDMATQICKFMGTNASRLLEDENHALTVRQGKLLKRCLKGDLTARELIKEHFEFETALQALLKALDTDWQVGDLENFYNGVKESVKKLKKSLFDFDRMEVFDQLRKVMEHKNLNIDDGSVNGKFHFLKEAQSWDGIRQYVRQSVRRICRKHQTGGR